MPSESTYMTEERIQSITFSESDVIKIIRALDVNKAHGHYNILVRMIKLCNNSVAHPLTISKLYGCWYICYPMKKSKYFSNP